LLVVTGKTQILFDYFFGPRKLTLTDGGNNVLQPSGSIFSGRFSNVGLEDGSWPLIGRHSDWTRSEWPMPAFCVHNQALKVVYSDENPNEELEVTSVQQKSALPYSPIQCSGMCLLNSASRAFSVRPWMTAGGWRGREHSFLPLLAISRVCAAGHPTAREGFAVGSGRAERIGGHSPSLDPRGCSTRVEPSRCHRTEADRVGS